MNVGLLERKSSFKKREKEDEFEMTARSCPFIPMQDVHLLMSYCIYSIISSSTHYSFSIPASFVIPCHPDPTNLSVSCCHFPSMLCSSNTIMPAAAATNKSGETESY